MQSLSIIQPDDWHCHLRDGALLKTTVSASASQFRHVIVMPNLQTPVKTCEEAMRYRERIMAACPESMRIGFEPLMTLYLTDNTTADEIKKMQEHDAIIAAKLYPAGVTTNSNAGIRDIEALYPIFEVMEKLDVPLLIHGEVADPSVDIFSREQRFIETILMPLADVFSHLRIVLEHITTIDAVQFIENASSKLGATITVHHLLLNRNDMLAGGLRPHYYCLPILKARRHQEALQKAAVSGNPHFFLGTDSAPHLRSQKERDCGCAGMFSAPVALPLYAEFFESMNTLDKLEDFSSTFGSCFYQRPVNKTKITLVKEEWQVPMEYTSTHHESIVPLYAGKTLQWKVKA
ncbi:MAG: pyrC [Gammaproteobacteria bacterium]|nr:pyrC [Gammaproteobacteria bacterium]